MKKQLKSLSPTKLEELTFTFTYKNNIGGY